MTRLARRALNYADMRVLAGRRLPRGVFEYIDGGAEDQVALGAIRDAWDGVKLHPRVLADVSHRSQAVELFGKRQPMPCIVAPTAMAGLVWHDGEVALARAAKQAGVPFCVSTQSVTSVERIAETGARLWFQLYMLKDRGLTMGLVDRAAAAGAEALVVTVDTAVSPKREYNIRNGFGIPLRPSLRGGIDVLRHPAWLWSVLLRSLWSDGVPSYAHYPPEYRSSVMRGQIADAVRLADDMAWNEIVGLRRRWRGPLILKGILRVDDAERAANAGIDGIVVSNHGGRNLDAGAPVPLVLARVADAVGHRITVLADSGIRRGSDVVKAMALGARATLLGRSVLYGVAAAGSPGAVRMLDIIRDEIDRTLAYVGQADITAIGRDTL